MEARRKLFFLTCSFCFIFSLFFILFVFHSFSYVFIPFPTCSLLSLLFRTLSYMFLLFHFFVCSRRRLEKVGRVEKVGEEVGESRGKFERKF